MKKIISIVLSVLCVAAMFTGCAKQVSGQVATDGSTSMEKVIGALGESFMSANSGVTFTYNPTGSGSGIKAVQEGRCDIGLSSRALKDEETASGLVGKTVAIAGIAIIGVAGSMKAASLSEEEKKAAVKDFNFPKGLAIALLAGFMSGCFNVGLEFGKGINFGDLTPDMYKTLPATLLVTLGGFITNAAYCFFQNAKNKTWGDYSKSGVLANNIVFCALAGALWYSQFFGLSLGKGFLTASDTLMTLSFCILMALNVVFSNVWGIILKEWKGCSKKTIVVLIVGIVVLIISSFLPQLV